MRRLDEQGKWEGIVRDRQLKQIQITLVPVPELVLCDDFAV
jgi:hypothetical protein